MSSSKADPRYTQRCDDLPVYYTSSADSGSDDEARVPGTLLSVRREWMREYGDEIEFLYGAYISTGLEVFGKAFHQLGTVDEFANFVFKYMQPGATKSDRKRDTHVVCMGNRTWTGRGVPDKQEPRD